MVNYYFEDFTETNYRNIVRQIQSKYPCVSFSGYKQKGKKALLRHDVDFSVHRAYALARIESEEHTQSTFFFWLHSPFYNIFEEEIFSLILKIIDMGHEIGIHFDCEFYTKYNPERLDILEYLCTEKDIYEEWFKKEMRAFSFHNPTASILAAYKEERYHGLINTYSEYFRNNFEYCSDSNGYWRFKRLSDLLRETTSENLHILLHPEWWTPDVLPPRQRIARCIDGRCKRGHEFYDKSLESLGRLNIS